MFNNALLSNRAAELADILRDKFKCYVSVGWMKEPDIGPIYMVYVDQRANVSGKDIPDTWYGLPVSSQDIIPPGTPASLISSFPGLTP